jgi:hypothetical protein
MKVRPIFAFGIFCAALLLCPAGSRGAAASDSLTWRTHQNQVDAEIKKWDLPTLLENISTATGWEVYLEPGTSLTVSTKFKNLPPDEALRRLLGKVNYSRSFPSNAVGKLFVYRTDAQAATQLIRPDKKTTSLSKKYLIPNELIVRLKRGAKINIDDLARLLGAKVVGRDDLLRAYRLQFADEAAANAARDLLNRNEEIASVDANYSVDRPAPVQMSSGNSGSGFSLNPKPLGSGSLVVGLIDTAVQPQDGLGDYLLGQISVAGKANLSTEEPMHGTAMFETILQAMGESPGKVLPVDVYGSNGGTTSFEVAQGILQAINAGANPINLSLGGTGDSEFLHALIQAAYQKGILFVAAAGNEPGTALTLPAAYPEVLAVTATDPAGNIESYANTGPFVDITAPGTSTIVLNGRTWIMKGTSVSTARMTGLITGLANKEQKPVNQIVSSIMATMRSKQ